MGFELYRPDARVDVQEGLHELLNY